MKIIINADDLGISHEVNAEIEKFIVNGCISSSTIMANAPAFEEAVSIAKRYPEISFGVHLNIIEFHPLTNQQVFAKYGLLDAYGAFIKGQMFQIESFTDELKQAIYDEWTTQVRKVRDAGIQISHLDSHQHTHGIRHLQEILSRVLQESDINRVRRQSHASFRQMLFERKYIPKVVSRRKVRTATQAQNKPKHSFIVRRLIQLVDGLRHKAWIRSMKHDFVITDEFQSYRTFTLLYSRYFKKQKPQIVELMCHPGHERFEKETEMVMSKTLNGFCDFQLISYNQL